MATRYAAIPAVPQGNLSGGATIVLVTALKENVELLTGTRGEEDLASKAVAIDQIKLNTLGNQDALAVNAKGIGYTISGQKVPDYDDYIKLLNDVQILMNDLFATREALDTLISQLKGRA
tara:strand:- start:3921 stop:4280 length:360 start_codon:yes stop_codon:yes gene_type:complete